MTDVRAWAVHPPGPTGSTHGSQFYEAGVSCVSGLRTPFSREKKPSRFFFSPHPAPPTREAPPDSSDLGTSTLARGVVRIILVPGKQQARREGTHGVGASGGRGTGQFAKTIAEAAVRQQEREKGSAWLRP